MLDRAINIISRRLAPLKSADKVRAAVAEAFDIETFKRYESALRTIALQSDAAMDGRDAGSWAKLVATNALKPTSGGGATMQTEAQLIAHLNETIAHLKMTHTCVVRGYEQAMEELGRQGDYEGKDWSEPYNYLKSRVEHFRTNAPKG